MIRIRNIALPLVLAASLLACSKAEPEAPVAAEQPTTGAVQAENPQVQEAAGALALIDACNIELLEPNSIEWNTKWDPAYSRDASQHPSGVRSAHWVDEERLATLQQANVAFPFELSCGSDAGAEYSILIEMLAPGSSLADIPRQTGSYPIVANAGKANPGEIVVGVLQFNGSSFEARSGNVTIERFDAEGAAGNFVLEGKEIGGENRPIRIEATFDMPCRRGSAQSTCQSDKAERE